MPFLALFSSYHSGQFTYRVLLFSGSLCCTVSSTYKKYQEPTRALLDSDEGTIDSFFNNDLADSEFCQPEETLMTAETTYAAVCLHIQRHGATMRT